MSETSTQISAVLEQLSKLEIAQKHYAVLKESIENMRSELPHLYALEVKELADVENLEKVNISSLFHQILGDKEMQLDKERQEYLAVNLKIKEINKTIELSVFEMNLVEKKILEVTRLKAELEELKKKRSHEIFSSNAVERNTLLTLHNSLDEANKQKNKIVQVTDSGRNALSLVEEVLNNLNIAIQNAEWDMYSRRNKYDYHKHTALDQAADFSYKAQIALNHFNKELLDLSIFEQALQLNLVQISKFTDTFFDNLISDWIIHNKIKNSFNAVDTVRDKIRIILGTLDNELKIKNGEMDYIKKSIDLLLISK